MRKIFSFLTLCMLALLPMYAQAQKYVPTPATTFKVSDAPIGDQWGTHTVWYSIKVQSGGYLNSAQLKDNVLSTEAAKPTSDEGYWCFVKDGANGYKIYNKKAGTAKGIKASGANFVVDADPTSFTCDRVEGVTPAGYVCVKTGTSGTQYWNRQNGKLTSWNSSWAIYGYGMSQEAPQVGGDQGSNFLFEQVDMDVLSRKGWTVETDSWCWDDEKEKTQGHPDNVLDGKNETFWHSNWRANDGKLGFGEAALPHTLVFNLTKVEQFSDWAYTPRQFGNAKPEDKNGVFKDYTFEVSNDKVNWTLIRYGRVAIDGDKQIWMPLGQTVKAQYVRLTVLSNTLNNANFATMAEFNLGDKGGVVLESQNLKNLPKFSNAVSPDWYFITFDAGNARLADQGNGSLAKTEKAADVDKQKWTFIGNEFCFIMKSKSGNFLWLDGNRYKTTNDLTKATLMHFVQYSNGTSLELQAEGRSDCMNQDQGGGEGRELANYTKGNNGNALNVESLVLPDPEDVPAFCTAQEQHPTWYFIQFKNGKGTIQDMGLTKSARTSSPEPIKEQLWKLVGTKENFQMVNQLGHYLVVSSEKETDTGAGPNNNPLRVSDKEYAEGFSLLGTQNRSLYPAWEIHPNDKKFVDKDGILQNLNQHGGAGTNKTLGFWKAGDGNNPLVFIAEADMYYADFKSSGIESYAPEHDLTLWYNKPATTAPLFNHDAWYSNWMEYSLPIGDGQFGGSLFGGLRKDEILFNEKTLWSGSPTEYGNYEVFGSVFAEYLGDDLGYTQAQAAKDYVRELDLTTAKGKVSFSTPGGVKYTREYIASHPARVIAARYTADQNGKINLRFTLESSKMGVNAATSYIKGDATYGEATFNGSLATIKYAARIKVVKMGAAGTLETTDQGIEVRNADEVLLVLAGGTDYDPASETYVSSTIDLAGDIQKRVNDAAAAEWETLYQQHLADFQHYFNRVDFQLAGTQNTIPTNELVDTYNKGKGADALMLEKLYFAYGRYLEISSSRGVDLPSNLQGIWCNNEKPAWNCDIHANINVQMNYWPAEPTNLSEMHLPFLNYISRMAGSAQWINNAKKAGRDEGWTCLTENNIFGGGGGFAPNYVIANAWYCTHLWQHYRYTLDKAYLKEVFPAMWNASRFWAGRLKLAEDGSYECPNEFSPEHGPSQDGVAHAQQLVWDLFDNTLKAIEVLGTEVPADLVTDTKLADLREKFAKLDKGLATEVYNGDWGDAIPTGAKLLREWKYSPYTAGANGHRHMSHLMCLYPFSQVEPGTELHTAAVNSLKLRGDGATGWSMGWKINLWARAQDGNHARTILSNALAHANTSSGVYYNLFDAHNPFQIDGNFGACSGIAEMIMQSNEGIVRILPALPTAWKEGYMKGLKAVGNFTVDVAWQEGKAVSAKIVSHKGEKLMVHHQDIHSAVVLVNGAEVTPVAVAGKTNIVEIPNVKAGDVVTISFDKTKGTLDISTKEGFGTVYADHAFVMPQGVKGSTVSGVTEGADGVGTLNTAWEYTEGTTVPAQTALVLKGAPGKYIYKVSTSNVAAEQGVNYLKGTLTPAMTENVVGTRYYMLTYSMEGTPAVKTLGFFWATENGAPFLNAAGKAYLAVPAAVAAQVRGFRLTDEVTSIEDTVVAEAGETAIYNLAGVRMNVELNQLPKGVYIVNGKKVIIK